MALQPASITYKATSIIMAGLVFSPPPIKSQYRIVKLHDMKTENTDDIAICK